MPEISFDNLGDIFPKGSLNEETFWKEKSDEEKARIKKAEDALMPCPFCGGKARIEEKDWADSDTYGVSCDSCWLYTPPFFKTLEDAVAFWNRRSGNANGTAYEAEYDEPPGIISCEEMKNRLNDQIEATSEMLGG